MKGAREVGDRRTEGEAAWALGRLYEEAGELERAVEHMRIRADFERSIGHVDAEKRAARIEAIRARLQ